MSTDPRNTVLVVRALVQILVWASTLVTGRSTRLCLAEGGSVSPSKVDGYLSSPVGLRVVLSSAMAETKQALERLRGATLKCACWTSS